MTPLDPKDCFRPTSEHFGSAVSPVAKVVSEPAQDRPTIAILRDRLTVATAALREIEASGHQSQYWLVRLAKEALRKIDRKDTP